MAMPGIRNCGVWVAAGILAALPFAVLAQAVTEDQVIAKLKGDGFTVIETKTTLLGRVRIMAAGPDGTREVVLNPRNGKVLRDIIVDEAPKAPVQAPEKPAPVVAPVQAPPVETEAARVATEAARVVREAPREDPTAEVVAPAEPSVADVGRALTEPVVTEALPDRTNEPGLPDAVPAQAHHPELGAE